MINSAHQRILITGVSGLLGNNLAIAWRGRYKLLGLYNTHPVSLCNVDALKVDLLQDGDIQKIVAEFKPTVVVHAAACADHEKCEKDPKFAEQLNVEVTRRLVHAVSGTDCKMIYISTDAVYDGEKGNFLEFDPVKSGISVYADSKYHGELAAQKLPDYLIVRTAFFGWNIVSHPAKPSLSEFFLRELSAGRPFKGFSDVQTSAIYTFHLAHLLALAIERDLRGVYHFASSTSIAKYDFAVRMARNLGLNAELIQPVSIDDAHLHAKRSKNLSLSVDKLTRDLEEDIPSIESGIDDFCKDYQSGLPEGWKAEQASSSNRVSG